MILVAFAEPIAAGHARTVTALVEWAGVAVTERSVVFGRSILQIPELAAPFQAGTFYAAVLAIAGAVIGAATLLFRARLTPGRVITGVAATICSTSGFFFWLTPATFPYTAGDFAAAWCRAEFVVWMAIPLLYAVILSPLPLSPGATLLYSSQTVLYAMWFSAVRLTVLLIAFDIGGLIWMAPAYFFCGFLLDFLFIVAYYSLAVGRAARRLESNRQVWRW